jgi:hypothetical protein
MADGHRTEKPRFLLLQSPDRIAMVATEASTGRAADGDPGPELIERLAA